MKNIININKTNSVKNTIQMIAIAGLAGSIFFSCNPGDDVPTPHEEELITTLRLNVTGDSNFSDTFIYKVENGFGNNTGGIQIDTIRLEPNKSYTVSLEILNEAETPAEDVTEEIIEEKDDHLFLFRSTPASGNGSISFTSLDKDNNGLPLNQTIQFNTGNSGTGSLQINLMHLPTDKNGTTPQTAGGSTDLEAVLPVILQ